MPFSESRQHFRVAPEQSIPPASVTEIQDGTASLAGQNIRFEHLPAEAVTIAPVAADGNYLVLSDKGGVCGLFNTADLPTDAESAAIVIRPLTLDDLFVTGAEGEYSTPAEQNVVLRDFQEDYRKITESPHFVEYQFQFAQLSLKEQAMLVFALSVDEYNRTLSSYVQLDQPQYLRAALMSLAYSGSTVPFERVRDTWVYEEDDTIARPDPEAGSPVEALITYSDRLPALAQTLHAQLVETFGGEVITLGDVTRGLMASAYRTLTQLESGKTYAEAEYLTVLEQPDPETRLILSFFDEMIGHDAGGRIYLQGRVRRHHFLAAELKRRPEVHTQLVERLLQLGKLKPSPELFWREDRTTSEYNERTGLNVIGLAQALAAGNAESEILFELGAGSGRGLAERAEQLSGQYVDFAINDQVYYPLRTLLASCIDSEALQLSLADQAILTDYIYKVLYDQAAISSIAHDPNALKKLLADIGPKLQQAEAVPSEYGIQPQPDGSKIYPNKIHRHQLSPGLQQALQLFSENPTRYLKADVMADDLKQHIPIFPVGMMVDDFSGIAYLKSKQIKLAVDVRAVVYLQGERYTNFLVAMVDKLKDTGAVYVSDSIRENFGKVYRLPEVVAAQRKADPGVQFYVVLGPGVPGDDHNQTAAIRSVIITKGKVPISLLESQLTSDRYAIRSLDDVVNDEEYVRSLDATGTNYERLHMVA